ncbi:MAG: DNA-3-methyladenine glycosylase [Cyclobacteriaceae bacterium]|nr:DNA-3-methyladenine glycosylase [Cyclobacteriaceae bacterium]UYN85182.1 MAG: DNA-3-methyladenine glycosylase [Cyclobacteriaceae bacterium]
MKLEPSFYTRKNVVSVARSLIGKLLVTTNDGSQTSGIIVETEAYSWKERGCHAYGGRKTARNEVMFEEGGRAYVYLCYGVHNLFNVVTNQRGVADAVLVRAIEPVTGVEEMYRRRGQVSLYQLTSGPGKLTRALGIDRTYNGKGLYDDDVWIEDIGMKINSKYIEAGKRIGIDYAGADANLPWRFWVRGNKWVSRIQNLRFKI